MHFEVKLYKDISIESWDTFVKSSSMGWAYHLYNMIAMDWNVENPNKSFAIVDTDNKDEIYFVIQMHQRIDKPKVYFSRWGYVLKDNLSPKVFKKVRNCFSEYIDKLHEDGKVTRLTIALPPLSEANKPENCSLINPLGNFYFSPYVRYTAIVDLSKPDDRLLADCEETTRQAIRKIEKSGQYEIVESNGSREDFDIYIKLHKTTFMRTDAENKIKSDKYHENMFFNLLPNQICRIFFLRDKVTNKIVADVAILIYKNTAYYWWGASDNHVEIGVNKYLLFNVISLIRKSFNYTGYFETGGVYPYQRNHTKDKGMSDFKKCFGTFFHPIYEGEYCFLNKKLSLLQRVFSITDMLTYKQLCILGIKIKFHK